MHINDQISRFPLYQNFFDVKESFSYAKILFKIKTIWSDGMILLVSIELNELNRKQYS